MSIIIDLIIVGILLLCIFLGFKRGLTGSLLKILSFVIAIVVAFILYKPVASYIIDHTIIDETIEQSIVSTFIQQEKENQIQPEDPQEETKNMPNVIVDHINEAVENATEDAKTTIVKESARGVAITIVNMGSAIIVFLLAKILLVIVRIFTKFVTDLPIVKQVDKTGGIIYGILEGLVIIYVIFAIITFISPMIGNEIPQIINHSFLGSLMYHNNLLLKIIF